MRALEPSPIHFKARNDRKSLLTIVHLISTIHFVIFNLFLLYFISGFSKLYSLEHLNLAHNELSSVSEVGHLSSLPCLESLTLTGNPLTSVIDYRLCVLELFLDRAAEVRAVAKVKHGMPK